MTYCVLCKIINKEIPSDSIYEDEKILVTLDIDWAVKGHTLIIWKKHHLNLSDLSEKDYLYFSKILYKVERSILKITKKERSIVLKTGLLVSHFHFHIYPTIMNISLEDIEKMIEKKIRYKFTEKEKEEFIRILRKELSYK